MTKKNINNIKQNKKYNNNINYEELKKLKINFKKGGNKSNKPYILELPIFKKNELLLNNPNLLKYEKEFSPLSGSELKYNPKLWNENYKIKDTHNCYTYAFGKIVNGLTSKAQPGYASGYNHIKDNEYTCQAFRERLKRDSPGSYLEKFDNSCIPGFYKVFLALDVKNDYHWWRHNKDGYWSHKPGSTEVTDVDADGKKIKNPLEANRNYDSLNYYKPCFFACVYSDLTRSIDNIYNI
jgi:hypothetical protein